ncbi:sterol desaturase family protein [Hyphococcus flavus]|uniref:Sterol desaturase family protein n=1 Tax=Hyphococcus flavus TaxID=1866326 RepID=A0AAE9ZAU4_9PROT|nr:sterol desaturase family protein [Hyphococcus flavus]WDI31014.1 sterol desaturase family protein [Hyphococcus flavus]
MSATPYPASKARLVRNFGLWVIVLIASPIIVAPLTALGANQLLWVRTDSLQMNVLVLAGDIILLDLWTYWLHRAWHRVPVMWRFHKVHHFDEFLDSTSSFRFHLGEVAVSAALRLIPIAVLAIPFAHVIVFETVLLCAVIFHHSNLQLPERFENGLSRVMITPSIHWVHHHAVMRDTHSNYGAIFSVWDRLFHSQSKTKRTPKMKIGVESIEDKPFLGLILTPFMRSKQ